MFSTSQFPPHNDAQHEESFICQSSISDDCDNDGTCTGYLDTVLTVFQRYNHPFVLVGTAATRRNGCRGYVRELDVLVRSSQIGAIVDDLVSSKQWAKCDEKPAYAGDEHRGNETAVKDIWLEARFADTPATYLGFAHLRFWPEELYQLSVIDCQKIEVPDAMALNSVQLEEDYHRDQSRRFGPNLTDSVHAFGLSLTPGPKHRARSVSCQDIPIFIPTVQSHLNSLLDQYRAQAATGLSIGSGTGGLVKDYIRYNLFDWPPARDWLLESGRIEARNMELMEERIRKYRRKPALSWDKEAGKYVFVNDFFKAVLGPLAGANTVNGE
ncbi:hypothetical protein MMC17_002718 [Xylographa soralifera]|nr:hypothetical protein [Xylographa soralifera]